MGFFSRKKEWDTARSDENKAKMRQLFNSNVENGDDYHVIYGYSQEARFQGMLITRSVTTFTSLVVGYRASDMSIVILPTTPDFSACGQPEFYKKAEIKKAKIAGGEFTIWNQGGLMAGYTQFGVADENDEDYLAYIYQKTEGDDFEAFWKEYCR